MDKLFGLYDVLYYLDDLCVDCKVCDCEVCEVQCYKDKIYDEINEIIRKFDNLTLSK